MQTSGKLSSTCFIDPNCCGGFKEDKDRPNGGLEKYQTNYACHLMAMPFCGSQ